MNVKKTSEVILAYYYCLLFSAITL